MKDLLNRFRSETTGSRVIWAPLSVSAKTLMIATRARPSLPRRNVEGRLGMKSPAGERRITVERGEFVETIRCGEARGGMKKDKDRNKQRAPDRRMIYIE